ncbi:MAG TPA: hypothetical protein VMU48_20580 [Terracidiphilus sp.]|nr:hypothetical protein [Terracidiphilus sp.]
MRTPKIVILAGPSQIGKSAVIRQLVEEFQWKFVTTYTTRLPRPEERDGKDYHFLTRSKFQEMIRANVFVEWDYFLASYGGIGRRTFYQPAKHQKVLHAIARMALRLEKRSSNAMAVFLAPQDRMLVYERIERRFSDPLVVKDRMAHVEEEMLHAPLFGNVVTIGSAMTVAEVAAVVQRLVLRTASHSGS